MIKYCTDLHLIGADFIDNAVMDIVSSIVDDGDTLVIGGDVFDTYRIGLSNTVFYDRIIEIATRASHIYILTGNHDISQGVCSFRLFGYAEHNITIVEDYYYTDIDDVRYHFLNHFRYNPTTKFSIGDGINVLFSHAEINTVTEIPKSFSVFDRVYNGHIHDMGVFANIVNVGALRQTKKNEEEKRNYLSIDGKEYKSFGIDTPVKIIEYEYRKGLKIKDEPSIVRVFVHNADEKQELAEYSDTLNNVIVKTEFYNRTKEVVGEAKSIIRKNTDIAEIFKSYVAEYEKRFKSGVDKETLSTYFSKHIESAKSNDVFDIKFEEVSGENFKLFPSLSKTFYADNGVVLVKGVNKDEVDALGHFSSNESGKTALRQAMEYAIKGSEVKISPLRVGAKKGNVCFSFSVNGTRILFTRSFTQKTSDLRIEVDGKEYNKDMTNTDKMITFYKDYPIKHFFDLLFLSNNDWILSFFNPRSNQKSKILSELFPTRMTITFNILASINARLAELKNIQKENTDIYNAIKNDREVRAYYLWEAFFTTRRSIESCKEELTGLAEVPEVVRPKYTYAYVSAVAKTVRVGCPEKPIDIQSYMVGDKYDIDRMQKLLQEQKEYKKQKAAYEGALNCGYSLESLNEYVTKYYDMREGSTSDAKREIEQITKNIEKMRQEYKEINSTVDDVLTCHTCGQEIKDEGAIASYKSRKLAKLDAIKKEGIELADVLQGANERLKSIIEQNAVVEGFRAKYTGLTYQEACIYKELLTNGEPPVVLGEGLNLEETIPLCTVYNNDLDRYNEYKRVVTEEIDAVYELNTIHAYENYVKAVEARDMAKYALEQKIASSTVRLGEIISKIRALNKGTRREIKDLNLKHINSEVSIYSDLVETMSSKRIFNFTSYYSTMFLREIEQVINSYLNVLFTRPVAVTVDEETNDFKFSDGKDERAYDDFSRGAKTKIEIALVLALITIQCESGLSTNLMFIDEFLDSGVDETNISRVVTLLKEVFSSVGNILLVSHKNIEDIVDDILYVEREGGRSILKTSY